MIVRASIASLFVLSFCVLAGCGRDRSEQPTLSFTPGSYYLDGEPGYFVFTGSSSPYQASHVRSDSIRMPGALRINANNQAVMDIDQGAGIGRRYQGTLTQQGLVFSDSVGLREKRRGSGNWELVTDNLAVRRYKGDALQDKAEVDERREAARQKRLAKLAEEAEKAEAYAREREEERAELDQAWTSLKGNLVNHDKAFYATVDNAAVKYQDIAATAIVLAHKGERAVFIRARLQPWIDSATKLELAAADHGSVIYVDEELEQRRQFQHAFNAWLYEVP